MKVENLTSPRSGREVANQFVIRDGKSTVFQSYRSTIVKITGDKTYLDAHYWDYSVTTGKYRNQFLGESKAETQRKIDSGEYVLTNLN